jgi:glycosyltransferase involved in cell wall biosynthesis
MIWLLFFLVTIYVVAISALIFGFTKINAFEYTGLTPKTGFSIIISFRNEADNLPLLLDSISKLHYPTALFEVILVDDDSEDGFNVPNSASNIRTIKNKRISNSPKKDAITTAMQFVQNDWIITTDADCIVNPNWLLTLDNYIQLHHPAMIAGAVTYNGKASFLHYFQQLDLASLQGATIGSFGLRKGFMCNGANFAYTKTFFQELNGFDGNDKIASGDDVFLLQKAMAKSPEKVHYLKSKNTIVTTKPVENWKSLFYQRVRWASKTSSYQSTFGKYLGLIVFLGNLTIVLGLGFAIWEWPFLQNIIIGFLFKSALDAVLIVQSNRFLGSKKTPYLIEGSLLYPFWSVSVALYSLFGKYEWKGRIFNS